MASPEFLEMVRRKVRTYLQEIVDSCPDCVQVGAGGTCQAHEEKVHQSILHPEQFIREHEEASRREASK